MINGQRAAATEPARAAIARAFCRRTGWRKPDGGLKSMMAKVVMLKMHRDGIIAPPPPLPAPKAVDEVRPLEFRIVRGGARKGRLWNGFVARWHCPGCTRLVGAQMRHDGGACRASGWIRVGTTKVRGRYDRSNRAGKPKKGIWLCPLRKDWKRTPNR